MNIIGYRTIKTGIGAAMAIIIAMSLGLKYSTAAGIIAILSIQNTKRQSLNLAIQRIGACILALSLSSILFEILGFNAIVFGIFLIIFIPLANKLKLNEGIVVSSVLVTHLLVEKKIDAVLIGNEITLMIIGVSIALLLNLYMPSIENQIKEDQKFIEDSIREILRHMSTALKECSVSIREEQIFNNLDTRLKIGRERAYRNSNNSLFLQNTYYAKYMDMRIQQFSALKNMRRHFDRFYISYAQSMMIADFTMQLSNSIHEYNTAEGLLINFQKLRESFTTMELPKTREEFENRAMLYQFLNDLELFLLVKNEFKNNIDKDSAINYMV